MAFENPTLDLNFAHQNHHAALTHMDFWTKFAPITDATQEFNG